MKVQSALRTLRDYLFYLLKLRADRAAVIATDIFFAAIATVTLHAAAGTTADLPARVLFALSILRLCWGLWKIGKAGVEYFRGSTLRFAPLGLLDVPARRLKVTDLLPSMIEKESGFGPLSTTNGEVVFRSPKVDRALQEGKYTRRLVRSTVKEDRLRRHIAANRDRLAALLTRKAIESLNRQAFFNDEKLAVASDVLIDGTEVKYSLVGYFDSFLTNEASSLVMEDANGDRRMDFTDLFPFELTLDGTACLKPLGTSVCANHMGISTVGVTRDQHIVVWEQSPRAQQSQGLLAPTGSGSADGSDLKDNDLLRTLEHAMRRELHEESVRNHKEVPFEKIGKTTVLGYFRWLRRAGKPEFVGLTDLAVDSGDLEPNPSEVRLPVTKVAHCYPVPTLDALQTVLSSLLQQRNLSVPLELNLVAIRDSLESSWSRERIKTALRHVA